MVEEVVGNVTSFLRRWVMGALEHQHAPLPQDEDGPARPYQFSGGSATHQGQDPWWLKWSSSAPPGYSNYAPTLQSDSDHEMQRDEQYQMEEAMRRSRQDWRGDEGRDRDRDGYEYGGRERGRGRGGERDEETEEERERRDLERAMEISRQEAEAAERARRAEPLPDLMSMEADLLGLGDSAAPSGSASAGPTSGAAPGAGAGARAGAGASELVPYDPTANDEAIARTLNLLDSDFGPSDADLMSKISGSKPQGGADVDLMALVDGPTPGGAPGLDSQSGALVAINPNKPFFRPSAVSQGLCAGCGRKIEQGRFLNCLDRCWHPHCFKCKGCSLPISEQEFKNQDGAPFHDACWKRQYHPKCTVCNDYIPPGEGGLIQFRTVPFWEDKLCTRHASDGTPECTSCRRYEPAGVPFVDLNDGRKVCLECVDTVVVDSQDCVPLFVAVQEFFAGLGMPIRQDIPLLCVELQALNEAAQGEKGHAGHSVTRGLCLSEEHTVRSVVRPRGPPGARGLPFSSLGQKVETLTRHCEVTAILVLYGLPRLLTGEILAHELMHAWLRLDGRFPQLSADVEEGLCQVLAHLWLQAQASTLSAAGPAAPGTPEAFQGRLVEFCMHQIAMDTSPVYGEGFRRAYTATVQHGLLHTLEVVRTTGQLPL